MRNDPGILRRGGENTVNVPVVVETVSEEEMNEPMCIESAQVNAGIMRGGCPTLNASHEQPILLGSKKQHAGVTEDGISTTLTSQEKERPIVGGGEAMNSVVRRLTPLE